MCLLGEAMHRLSHTVKEERLRLLLAAVAVGASDQLLRLWHGQRGEKVGEGRLQRAAQPDIEEIRQISVTDVVVIWRVSGNDLPGSNLLRLSINLLGIPNRRRHH